MIVRYAFRRFLRAGAFGAVIATAVGATAGNAAMLYGEKAQVGEGTVRTYIDVGAAGRPVAVGIELGKGALRGLPAKRNRTSRCFDVDKNGQINDHGECEGDYESQLDLPKVKGLPFKWIGFNWNPEGHPPPPWLPGHFDFHFYTVDKAAIAGIRVGSCGIFIDCEDFKRATKAVPATYVHPEHVDVKAAVGRMGNHLIDSRSPELAKENPTKFTHTWIFGAYDGKITFYEPMITREYLQSRPDDCVAIKQPKAWAVAGYYPTRYCMRYRAASGATTVSLEGLVHRIAR